MKTMEQQAHNRAKSKYKFEIVAGETGEFVGFTNTIKQVLTFLGANREELEKTKTGYALWNGNYRIIKLK